jgi:hypothetical protein
VFSEDVKHCVVVASFYHYLSATVRPSLSRKARRDRQLFRGPPAYRSSEGGHATLQFVHCTLVCRYCMRETVLGGGGVSTLATFDKDACLFAFDRPPRTTFGIFALRKASPRAKMGAEDDDK